MTCLWVFFECHASVHAYLPHRFLYHCYATPLKHSKMHEICTRSITKLAGQTRPWEVEYRLQLAGKSNPFTTNRYFDFGLVAVFSILESGSCSGGKVLSSADFSGH